MSAVLEQFYKTTAINAWDIMSDSMPANPVAVNYCPVDVQHYPLRQVGSVSDEQQVYIDKAVKFAKEELRELGGYIDVPEETILNVLVDSIRSGWNDIMEKGHTVGVIVEVTGIVGFGMVAGVFIAYDKTGRSIIGFAGMAAGAAAEISGLLGGFYYSSSREGLEGWSGEFNASAAFFVGAEWEAMFTGRQSGHVVGATAGFGIALSVEFQYAWLISEKEG